MVYRQHILEDFTHLVSLNILKSKNIEHISSEKAMSLNKIFVQSESKGRKDFDIMKFEIFLDALSTQGNENGLKDIWSYKYGVIRCN